MVECQWNKWDDFRSSTSTIGLASIGCRVNIKMRFVANGFLVWWNASDVCRWVDAVFGGMTFRAESMKTNAANPLLLRYNDSRSFVPLIDPSLNSPHTHARNRMTAMTSTTTKIVPTTRRLTMAHTKRMCRSTTHQLKPKHSWINCC